MDSTNSLSRLTAALADRYRIERELGAGGMATVYLADDLRHERKVALKVLRPELAAVLGAERFLKEIRVTANLQHPHILPLHDSGEFDGMVFYVMPFVEGESLRDRLNRERQLPVDDAIRIAREVLSALDYAHRRGVVHRDIKPENILLHDNQALVADFGIALAVSTAGAGTRMTETGLSLGTPHYMSPEQAMGEREISPRSDVYAMGAVLYEMLLGEPPFTGPTAQSIIARVITEEPRGLRTQRKTIPPAVEAAVHVALQKLPADRFATAHEFADALSRPGFTTATLTASDATPLHAQTIGTGRWAQRARILAPAVLTLALGILVGAWWAASRVRPPRLVQFTVAANLGESATGSHIGISADGATLVYVSVTANNRSQLFARTIGELTPIPISGTEGSIVKDPVFSPDGLKIAYYADQQLRVALLSGGAARPIAKMSPLSGGISWKGNDELVFQPEYGSALQIINANSGTSRPALSSKVAEGVMDYRWPHILPDGNKAIVTIWRGITAAASIGIVSLPDGAVTELFPGIYAQYANGYLVYALASGTLQAVPFDAKKGRARGEPTTIVDSIAILSNGLADFTLSSDGTLAYVVRAGNRVPVVADLGGGITSTTLPAGAYESPRLSPDGASVVAGYNENIWLHDLRVGTFSALTAAGGFYPEWMSGGKRILYSNTLERNVHVFAVPADRSAEESAVLTDQGQYRVQDVSVDDQYVLLRVNNVTAQSGSRGRGAGTGAESSGVARSAINQYDIWVMNLAGPKNLRPWLTTPYLERAPTFSPNGKWVAYSSDESGRDEIYVRAFPGPGGRTLVSLDGGTEPAWTRDGAQLIYRSGDRFEIVSVQTTGDFRMLGRPRSLFQGKYYAYPWQRQYDVFPDGKHLLLLKSQDELSGVRVLINALDGGGPRRAQR